MRPDLKLKIRGNRLRKTAQWVEQRKAYVRIPSTGLKKLVSQHCVGRGRCWRVAEPCCQLGFHPRLGERLDFFKREWQS